MAPGSDVWSFRCSACGKCCNSAPQMSLPELLHHQRRFVGCLAIRRVSGGALAGPYSHALPGPAGDLLLATHAFGFSGASRCPALGEDMRCAIHHDRKPAACEGVPLDALAPDHLQHAVLAERRADAAYMGADCLAPGERAGAAVLTRRLAVVDEGARTALARRRHDLADDKRWWGDAVFRMLRPDLVANPAVLGRLPAGGLLFVAIAPVLLTLAGASPRCRARCAEYVDAQLALIASSLRDATGSGLAAPAELAQLRAFERTHRALKTALAGPPRASSPPRADPAAIEAWMGLAS